MTIGIVLSGGGAKGDFQVGALRFLYNQGIRPDILSGTSVGAINAAKLAEGENPADPTQGLTGLERIWESLQRNSDMYVDEAWLHHPDMHPAVRDALTGRSSDFNVNAPADGYPQWGDLSWFAAQITGLAFLLGDGASLLKSLALVARQARALFNLGPIRQKLDQHLDTGKVAAWGASGRKLRLAVVGLESGRLRYVTETGQVVERDGTPALVYPSIPAACRPLADQIAALQQEIAAKQAELKTAPTSEKAALLAEIRALKAQLDPLTRQLEECKRVNASGVPAPAVNLRTGVLASAAIPGVFLPVGPIAGDTCVDGGVREVLPLQVALDLGATTVYAISASPPDSRPSENSYANAKMMSIVSRSVQDLLVNEVSRDDARPGAAPPGTQIISIRPDEEIHDTTVVDPGLIQISRDYGYMRAADVLAQVDRRSRRWALPTLIAVLRRQIWALENRRWGHEDPSRPADPVTGPYPPFQSNIDAMKGTLQALVNERRSLGGPMPPEIDVWSQRLERHPWLSRPFGNFEGVVRAPGGVRVSGWTIDPDTSSPIDVHVHIDGAFAGAARADRPRPDVGAANPGYGDAHGFDFVVPAPAGDHTVCVWGINVGQGWDNPQIGCRTISVAAEPFGNFESVAQAPPGARVTGWAIDPDTSAPVDVHVYVDGAFRAQGRADRPRPDVGAAHPGYGDAHGFDVEVPVQSGWHRICVFALNWGPGSFNPELGCRWHNVPKEKEKEEKEDDKDKEDEKLSEKIMKDIEDLQSQGPLPGEGSGGGGRPFIPRSLRPDVGQEVIGSAREEETGAS